LTPFPSALRNGTPSNAATITVFAFIRTNEQKGNITPKPEEEKAIYKKQMLQQQSREEGLHVFVEEEEIDDILMSSDELNVMFVRALEDDKDRNE